MVGEVVEVGTKVSRFVVGDIVGSGSIAGSCGKCGACKSNISQYCNNRITTFNDVYTDGNPTQGGFAYATIVHQNFLVRIPVGLAPQQAAPLLCAGITAYSPLKHFGLAAQTGLRGAILGLGGVGHVAVKLAKAMGHHVTVITSSVNKTTEAIEHLDADAYLLSTDVAMMKAAAESFDYIIDTVPVYHPLEPYLSLLKVNGNLILLGLVSQPLQFAAPLLQLGRRTISGSFVGSTDEIEEMLEFCEKKGVTTLIEIVKMDKINEAMKRLERNDVRYRFVVDVAGSNVRDA